MPMDALKMRPRDKWIVILSFAFSILGASLLFLFLSNHDNAAYANLPDDPQLLIDALANPDQAISVGARRKLCKRRELTPLFNRLNDRNPDIRGLCVLTLTNIGDPSSIPEIAKLERDPNPWVRRWVAYAMRQFNDHQEATVIQERMKLDQDSSVRSEAKGSWF
jgi:HEAT repeat protein